MGAGAPPVSKIAGRISLHKNFWQSLTIDPVVLEYVQGFKIPFVSFPEQTNCPNQIKCCLNEKLAIDHEILGYVERGIIEEVSHCEGEFISQIFPRPKKSGGVRIILNLSKLNEHVEFQHFKMETLSSVLLSMEENCFMASIDLQDAYYTVKIDREYRKFLRFKWNGKLFQFTCLPNGLSCAPRIFTKLLKPIFMNLRKQGFISAYYLDDS